MAVVSSNINCLHVADDKSKICPRTTATELCWDACSPGGCIIDQDLRSLSWFLLIPSKLGFLIGISFAGDDDALPREKVREAGDWTTALPIFKSAIIRHAKVNTNTKLI